MTTQPPAPSDEADEAAEYAYAHYVLEAKAAGAEPNPNPSMFRKSAPADRTERPLCKECARTLAPYRFRGHPVIDPDRRKAFGYEGNGVFCSLRCGYKFALRTVKLRKKS